MTKQKNYKKTLIACYLGFVTQAISANFTPLLFLTFKNTYGIGFEKIALIPKVFFCHLISQYTDWMSGTSSCYF